MTSTTEGHFDPQGTSITIKDVYLDGLYESVNRVYSNGITDEDRDKIKI